MHYTKRCWVEVDLDALLFNARWVVSRLSGEQMMAVVKAEAYGCGAEVVCRTLSCELGVSHWAVANIDEGQKLREAGIGGEILILGYTPPEEAGRLHAFDLTQTLLCLEYAKQLSEAAKRERVTLPTHIAIDTGMNRIGFVRREDVLSATKLAGLVLTGSFTHLCHADSLSEQAVAFTNQQLARFSDAVSYGLPAPHCQNSAAIITGAGAGFSYARPGIILYGFSPSDEVCEPSLRPVMSWRAKVSMVKKIASGETVGYGQAFRAEKPMEIATIPVGYADGYSRLLSGRGRVLIHGKWANVLGRVCMDQMMVDVTGIGVKMDDVATLFGRDGQNVYSACDMARDSETIPYEVICGVSKRVPRVYLKDGKEVESQAWI